MDLTNLFNQYEKATYNINIFKGLEKIEKVGEIKTTLRENGMNFDISMEMSLSSNQIQDQTKLSVLIKDFSPNVFESNLIVAGEKTVISGKYYNSKMSANAVTKDGTKKISLNIPPNSFDQNSLLYLLRASFFFKAELMKFTIVNTVTAQCIMTEIEHFDIQEVTSVIGTIKCNCVKLTFPELPQAPSQKFLYRMDKPYLMVRNINGSQVMDLVDYEL